MTQRALFLLLAFLATILPMAAYEQAFPKTATGSAELKVIPAAHLIAASAEEDYFDSSGSLFRPLFRYIQANDIAMTTPVEAEIAPGVMYFYIGSDVDVSTLSSTGNVELLELPERLVASYGARGGYSESNFKEAEKRLRTWLSTQQGIEAEGEARAIYWNGPYIPGPFKRFEVHIPVKRVEADDG